MRRHTLSVLVQDEPGVLARISALFARRGFNIESLAVGNTELAGISRMTIVVNVEDSPLEQVTKQLNKLINVLKIVELDPNQSVEHQLIMGTLNVSFDGGKTNVDAIQKVIAKSGHDPGKYQAPDDVYKALPECCLYRQ